MTKNKLLGDLVSGFVYAPWQLFICVGRHLLNNKVRVANWTRLNSSWKT